MENNPLHVTKLFQRHGGGRKGCGRVLQGAQLRLETVAGLPGGAGHPAGVGERRAPAANHQPGHQLLLRTVSVSPASCQKGGAVRLTLARGAGLKARALLFQGGVREHQRPGRGGLPPEDAAPQHGHVGALQPVRPLPEAASLAAQNPTALRR